MRIARFEQRLVEGLAVVGNEDVEALQVFGQSVQLRSLLAIVAHEELPDAETVRFDAAAADEERIGAGAARQDRWSRCRENTTWTGCERGIAPSESESSRSSGRCSRSAIPTLP